MFQRVFWCCSVVVLVVLLVTCTVLFHSYSLVVFRFSLLSATSDAVTNIKRNPFIGLKIQRVEWPVEMLLATSKADPEKLVRVEVTPDDLVVGLGINARNKKHAAGDRYEKH